jgi:hypothetical protein
MAASALKQIASSAKILNFDMSRRAITQACYQRMPPVIWPEV